MKIVDGKAYVTEDELSELTDKDMIYDGYFLYKGYNHPVVIVEETEGS